MQRREEVLDRVGREGGVVVEQHHVTGGSGHAERRAAGEAEVALGADQPHVRVPRRHQDVRAVAACGDTVAVAHDIDRDHVDRGSWLEIRQAGASTRTVVWLKGTGSSIGDLTAGPRFVTWYLYNGQYNDDVYLFDLASQRLYEFSAQQARNRVVTDGTFVWWLQPAPESDTYRTAVARVAAS